MRKKGEPRPRNGRGGAAANSCFAACHVPPLTATALASAFGVAMTKQKMEELLGAGCDGEGPLQHKEQMGGLMHRIGALHTR